MDISKSEIERLAALSKLNFSDDEIEFLIPEFEKIINFASEVNNSKFLSGAESNPEFINWDDLREDCVKESLTNEKIFQENSAENGFFVVHKVVG